MNRVSDTYWAAGTEDELTSRLMLQRQTWGSQTSSYSFFTAMMSTWRRNLVAYYSPLANAQDWTTSLGFSGDQGELVNVVVPVARTLTRQFVALVTKQRLFAEALASSTDTNTVNTARLGKAVANKVIDEQCLEKKIEAMAEQAAVLGAAFASCVWNPMKGKSVGQGEQGEVMYEGDLDVRVHGIRDVIYDLGIRDWEESQWVLIRTIVNRWDYAAAYPELADKIRAQTAAGQNREFSDMQLMSMYQDDSRIYLYEFYHKDCPSVPGGRATYFLDDNTVISDGENTYECLPIIQMIFEPVMGTGFGYPLLSSLLPAQEMLDHGISAQSTNQSALAVQSIMVPKGSDISAQNIGPLNFITYQPMGPDGGGKPEALQLTATPPEVPAFCREMERHMESLIMLNSSIRGNPSPGVTAGTAIATLSANAQEFLSSASRAVTLGVENILTMAVKIYSKYAQTPRIVQMIGERNVFLSREFIGKDLQNIDRIKIRLQSPLMNSVAGRTQVADNLLQTGLIKSPQQYLSVIEGAPTETLFETELSENLAVEGEIDAILQGKPVYPILYDNHPMFIRALQRLLYNPEIRANGQITQDVLELIAERTRLEMECPPEIKQMLRTGLEPQMMMPPPQQGGPQGGPPPKGETLPGMPDEPVADVAEPAQPPATV